MSRLGPAASAELQPPLGDEDAVGTPLASVGGSPTAAVPVASEVSAAFAGIFPANVSYRQTIDERTRGAVEADDPLNWLWAAIGAMQEMSIPLILGIVVALVYANVAPESYKYWLMEGVPWDETADCHDCGGPSTGGHHGGPGHATTKQFVLSDCPVFGHALSLHFVANDIIMVLFFGLASKEITEAMLPGGSLNPLRKAANPLAATLGGAICPVAMGPADFMLLKVLKGLGGFPESELTELSRGWGIVTATDISLAWLTARLVFSGGHPAIDYLLLLAVADDAIGLVIIAVFYPDPNHPSEPIWLLLTGAGVFIAFLLRRWHFRIKRERHQSWVPYVFLAGSLSWAGLMKAHLHPALALVPIVPFMPGPPAEQLESLNKEGVAELDSAVRARIISDLSEANRTVSQDSVTDALQAHHVAGRGREIAAGLHAGIVGHRVDPALRVQEFDDEGEQHAHASTLDDFEHSVKVYVDFGMFLFAVTNAGVPIEGLGGMSVLVLLSLALGKFTGIFLFGKLAAKVGFPMPLGVGNRHLLMVALIGGIGLTVALFVADVAFEGKLQSDAKLGAVLSGLLAPIAVAIGRCARLSGQQDIELTAAEQVQETLAQCHAEGDDSEDSSSSDDGA
ncbi:unnamed protein product [Prorocentrum cordatum]|uniref:Sodium/hydrogen exchanger n=1 Tax=Prorocentrum cordatum TaxID=2364126 RepID=A0ABN9SEI5_9DINO|nr:unnamed protein product [Polarella glacialis]